VDTVFAALTIWSQHWCTSENVACTAANSAKAFTTWSLIAHAPQQGGTGDDR
jgi:hypothetical protein